MGARNTLPRGAPYVSKVAVVAINRKKRIIDPILPIFASQKKDMKLGHAALCRKLA